VSRRQGGYFPGASITTSKRGILPRSINFLALHQDARTRVFTKGLLSRGLNKIRRDIIDIFLSEKTKHYIVF